MPEAWVIERLRKSHSRATFNSGSLELDQFLRRYARQNDDLGLGRTYVAVRPGDQTARVAGYYTLSSGSIDLADLPEDQRRRLPRYPVPVIHLGRLAVDRSTQGQGQGQGQGLGSLLLASALERAWSASEAIGALAVEVVALDEAARGFYLKHGFQELVDDRLHLYLPMRLLVRLFGGLRPKT